jgi:predicted RecA/RadA family phage recombinase
MALNEIYRDGFSLPLNFGSVDPSVDSGDFVVVDGLRGVAETDAVERADGDWYATVRMIGVFVGTTAEAATVGEAFYLAAGATNGVAVTDDDDTGSNFLVGYAIAPKAIGAGDVWIRVNN